MKEWLTVLAPYAASAVTLIALAFGSRKLQKIHVDMNSRFDEWRELIKSASYADGLKAGKAEGKK